MPNNTNHIIAPTGRRGFLRGSVAALGFTWLASNWSLVAAAAKAASVASAAGEGFRNLSPADAADLAAIAAHIIPTDETPGATEAGVIWFIDEALGGFMAGGAKDLHDGLAEFDAFVAAKGDGKTRFAELDGAQQEAILHARDSTPFFQTVHFLTLAGMFSMPSYGGNRDGVGWKLIGFDHRYVWAPPFGYYDAEAMKASGDGSHG
jgi:gluconate 2-dehydrogenase gamma chain